MKERPILFSGLMVKALIAGTKTQTRRVVTPQPDWLSEVRSTRVGGPFFWPIGGYGQQCGAPITRTPYGVAGDRLWVREAFGYVVGAGRRLVYRADGDPRDRFRDTPIEGMKWAPSIHMRRVDSRLTLEMTEVRVQRLQEISEEDAKAEGLFSQEQAHGPMWWYGGPHPVKGKGSKVFYQPLQAFADIWDSINGKRAPWSSNPWVWAITFKRAE